MKKIAIIGAGEAAIPYILAAKRKKVHSICFGNAKDSLYKDDCDEFVDISIYDVDGIVKACNERSVDGIIATSENTTIVAAEIANKLNLIGNSLEDGYTWKNKHLMRKKVSECSKVKQPEFTIYTEDATYSYPVVVKAVDSCGKRGITLVKRQEDLLSAVKYAKEYSTTGEVLVEEYLASGKEYSVECISHNGHHQIIQVTEKDSSGPPHFLELGHHQPAELGDVLLGKVNDAVCEVLDALHISTGPAHLEAKIIDDEVYFIEVGARAGGDHIADTLLNLSTEYDYFGNAILIALGEYVPCNPKTIGYSGIYFLCEQSKKISPLFHVAKNADWCKEYHLKSVDLKDVTINGDNDMSGYIVYSSTKKISLQDAVVRINEYPNAFELLYSHSKEIGRELPDEELRAGLKKWIDIGNVLAMIVENRIVAMLNVYCNDEITKNGYINNVYVIPEYRGFKYASELVKSAITLCKGNNFKSISLHVAEDNLPAVSTYLKAGFDFTDNYHDDTREMKLMI